MEALKGLVITLTSVLIFISAVELIAPKNKTKKYVSFVLGLILISVILNPIIKLISKGEESIESGIEGYTAVFSKDKNKIKSDSDNNTSFESNNDNEDTRKLAFVKNFNRNCESMLKKEYPDMTFKSDVDCDVDFNNIKIDIKKLRIGVQDKKIRRIQTVKIGKDELDEAKSCNEEYSEIVNHTANQLDIPKEKIEVYRLDE